MQEKYLKQVQPLAKQQPLRIPWVKIIVGIVVLVALIITIINFINSAKDRKILTNAKVLADIVVEEEKKAMEEGTGYFSDLYSRAGLINRIRGDNSLQAPSYEEQAALLSDKKMFGDITSSETYSQNTVFAGDYFLILNPKEDCLSIRYKTASKEETIFYVGYEENVIECTGKYCKKQAVPSSFCYSQGLCFKKTLLSETERPCEGGNGKQTRKCTADCKGGKCEGWGDCVCDKGFKWNGKICEQEQTEKDCTQEQCYNGIYCEDMETLNKEISNGSCSRNSACTPQKGWQYSPWECTCQSEEYCAKEDSCQTRPQNANSYQMENNYGSCVDITYNCENGNGWVPFARTCNCTQIGTYWDSTLSKAVCSPCTNAPQNSTYTTAGGYTNDCKWKCQEGFKLHKNACEKPNRQYLCASMKDDSGRLSTTFCTDEFSKGRKIENSDTTFEGQLCFSDETEPILFYSKSKGTCKICQCIGELYEPL